MANNTNMNNAGNTGNTYVPGTQMGGTPQANCPGGVCQMGNERYYPGYPQGLSVAQNMGANFVPAPPANTAVPGAMTNPQAANRPLFPTDAMQPSVQTPGGVAGGNLGSGTTQAIGESLPGLSFIDPYADENGVVPLTPWTLPSTYLERGQYLNGFMRSRLGRRMTVEFLMGEGGLISRTGRLLAVGYNYIILGEDGSRDYTACDFYNIKFVKVYEDLT